MQQVFNIPAASTPKKNGISVKTPSSLELYRGKYQHVTKQMFSKSLSESSLSGHFFGKSIGLSDLLQMKAAEQAWMIAGFSSSTFDFCQQIRTASGVTRGDNHLSNPKIP